MKPVHIKERRRKEVRQIWKERREVYKAIRNLPYHKLDKPIRHGWYKEVVLTQHVERYKKEPYIKEVFALLEKRYWGKTKEACEKRWENETSKYMLYNNFPTLSPKQYHKLSDKAKMLCTAYRYKCYGKWRKRYYVRIPKNTYKIVFSRAYLTKVQEHDPALHRRIGELERKLLRPGYYQENERLYRYKDFWSKHYIKVDRIKTKQYLNQLTNAFNESTNEILWERN